MGTAHQSPDVVGSAYVYFKNQIVILYKTILHSYPTLRTLGVTIEDSASSVLSGMILLWANVLLANAIAPIYPNSPTRPNCKHQTNQCFLESLYFSENPAFCSKFGSDRVWFHNYTITLHSVPFGNAQTAPLSESDF